MENKQRPEMPSGGNSNNQGKKPKTSFYWIYGIIILVLVGMQFMGGGFGSGADQRQNSFLDLKRQLLTDSVAKIVIVNNAIAEVYLSKKPVSDKKANDPYSFINGNDQAFDLPILIA
jgi:hypothetical protein